MQTINAQLTCILPWRPQVVVEWAAQDLPAHLVDSVQKLAVVRAERSVSLDHRHSPVLIPANDSLQKVCLEVKVAGCRT